MKTRLFGLVVLAGLAVSPVARAQEPPKPTPEHARLKKLEGTWDVTMNFGGMESKGTTVYKMDLGGLWLIANFEGDFGGLKFSGRGTDGYDITKKKYVSTWIDSMSTGLTTMEGTYNEDKKQLVMTGSSPGEDGKPMPVKTVSTFVDENQVKFEMFMGDSKEPAFTMVYKRRK